MAFGQMMRKFFAWWTVGRMGLTLAILGLVAAVFGHLDQYGMVFNIRQLFLDMYANLGTELFSIAITVLIIDTLHERREEQRRQERERGRQEAAISLEKERLIRQLGSTVNDQAKRAAEELRAQGWLEDGSLVNARLPGANLQGADLRHADLRGASLFRANLKDAGLFKVNLENAKLRAARIQNARLGSANLRRANLGGARLDGAYMSGADLAGADLLKAKLEGVRGLSETRLGQAHRLKGATMPDGKRYDGRFDLEGDLQMAKRDGIDIDDPDAMARWYASTSPGRRGKKEPEAAE